jgi:hypothetical protein
MTVKPPGPDKELINRAFRIKPVVSDRDGGLFFIEPIDLYEKMYTMDGLANAGSASGHVEKIGEFEFLMPATLWGGEVGGPTIAQVLPQIPEEFLEKAVAFYAHTADDRSGDNGYVRAKADVYGGTLPDNVKAQEVIAWRKTYTEPFPEPEPVKPQFNGVAATTLDEDLHVMKQLELKRAFPELEPTKRPPPKI